MLALMDIGGELRHNAEEIEAIGGITSYIRDWVEDGYMQSRIIEELEDVSASCGEIAGRLREIAGEVSR